jgi:Tyrosine-protein kinase ephrin type A/B receptor-like
MMEPRLLFLGLFVISVYTQKCVVELCSIEIACSECPIMPSLGCPQYTSTLSPGARSMNECVCIPGTFGSTGSVQCAPCPQGTITNTSGSVMCSPCPQGTFTNTSGSTMCLVSAPTPPPPESQSSSTPVFMIAGIAGAAAALTGVGIWAAVLCFRKKNRKTITVTAKYDVLAGVSIQCQSNQFKGLPVGKRHTPRSVYIC